MSHHRRSATPAQTTSASPNGQDGWGPNAVEETHYLRVYMGHLRQKIESDPTRPR